MTAIENNLSKLYIQFVTTISETTRDLINTKHNNNNFKPEAGIYKTD